jgi:hypothetical protein
LDGYAQKAGTSVAGASWKEVAVAQGDENCKGQEIVAGRPMLVSGVSTSGKTVWGEDEAMQAPVE